MTQRFKLRAKFVNGMTLEREYTGCQDMPEALDRFEAEIKANPVNLGAWSLTGITSAYEVKL